MVFGSLLFSVALDRRNQKSGILFVNECLVRDGAIWTAAGMSVDIDLTLTLVAEEAKEIAGKVELAASYCPEPMRYRMSCLVLEAKPT